MAERQPEEEERQFLCELCPKSCPKSYKIVKSLKRHMREKHAGHPLLEEAIKSVPKEKCPFCGEGRANLVDHKHYCERNPDVQKAPKVVAPTRAKPARGTPPPVPAPRVPQAHLDDDIVSALRRVFFDSPLVQQTMETFSSGTYLHEGCRDTKCMDSRCMLEIKTMRGAQNFLALAIFLSNSGLRLEVVTDVTLGGLRGGAMELNLSGRVMKIVTDFTWVLGRTNDPKFQPFKSASWPRMRTLLGRIIKPDKPRLWDAVGTQLGSHEFERLPMDEYASYEFTMTESQQLALQFTPFGPQLDGGGGGGGGGEEDGGGNASSTSEDLLAGYDPSADSR